MSAYILLLTSGTTEGATDEKRTEHLCKVFTRACWYEEISAASVSLGLLLAAISFFKTITTYKDTDYRALKIHKTLLVTIQWNRWEHILDRAKVSCRLNINTFTLQGILYKMYH